MESFSGEQPKKDEDKILKQGKAERYEEVVPRDVIRKTSSTGMAWRKRRQETREEMNSFHVFSVQDILGSKALSTWRFLKGVGPEREKIKDQRMPTVIVQGLVENKKKVLPHRIEETQDQLVNLAHKNPEAFYKLLSLFLLKFPDPGKAIKLLDPEYKRIKNKRRKENYLKRNKKFWSFCVTDLAIDVVYRYAKGEYVLPNEILMPMLEQHEASVLQEEERLRKEFQEYRIRIENILLEAVVKGYIPITKEVVIERLSAVDITVVDGLTAKLDEKWGDFTADVHRIRLATNIPEGKRWSVFVHEIMHAISGQIELVIEDEVYPEEFQVYRQTKVGTRFSSFPEKSSDPERRGKRNQLNLRWLNEALTEQITLDLLGQKDSWAYREERELLKHFTDAGLPRDLLRLAYFENYSVKPKGEHRNPALRQLFQTANILFGTRFLVNLDLYIRENSKPEAGAYKSKAGVKKALEMWDEKGKNFPDFINQWADDRD